MHVLKNSYHKKLHFLVFKSVFRKLWKVSPHRVIFPKEKRVLLNQFCINTKLFFYVARFPRWRWSSQLLCFLYFDSLRWIFEYWASELPDIRYVTFFSFKIISLFHTSSFYVSSQRLFVYLKFGISHLSTFFGKLDRVIRVSCIYHLV